MLNNIFNNIRNKINKEKKEAEEKLLNFNISGDIYFVVESYGIDESYDERRRLVGLKVNTILGETDITAYLDEDKYVFLRESLSFLDYEDGEELEKVNKEFDKNMFIKYKDYEDGVIIVKKKDVITKLAENLVGELERQSKISLSSKTKKQIKEKFIKQINDYIDNHNPIIWGDFIKKIVEKDLKAIRDIKNIKPVYENIEDNYSQAKKSMRNTLGNILKKLD